MDRMSPDSERSIVKKSTLTCLGIAALSVACFSYWALKSEDSAAVSSQEELRPIPGTPSAGAEAQGVMPTEPASVSKQTYELPSTHAVGASFENERSDERSTARAPQD